MKLLKRGIWSKFWSSDAKRRKVLHDVLEHKACWLWHRLYCYGKFAKGDQVVLGLALEQRREGRIRAQGSPNMRVALPPKGKQRVGMEKKDWECRDGCGKRKPKGERENQVRLGKSKFLRLIWPSAKSLPDSWWKISSQFCCLVAESPSSSYHLLTLTWTPSRDPLSLLLQRAPFVSSSFSCYVSLWHSWNWA